MTPKSKEITDIYTAAKDIDFVVESVPDSALLSCLGVYPKSVIRKSHCYKFGGPAVLHLSTRKVAIGKDLASQIFVSEV